MPVIVPSGGGGSDVATSSALDEHIAESDPFAHTAVKVSSDSTVAQGDVEADLSYLDANKADAAVVSQVTDALSDLLGGTPTQTTYDGAGTRAFYEDDFQWSAAVGTSGSIGETQCLKTTGGTTTAVASTAWRPGIINIATGTTANTFSAVYSPDGVKFRLDLPWEAHFWVRPNAITTDTTIRIGVTSDNSAGGTDTPTDAAFFEHLSADSAFWRLTTWVASSGARQVSVRATSTEWQHFCIRQINSTTLGFSLATSTGGINTALLSEETVTISAFGSVFGHLFANVKNGTTTTKTADIDRWQRSLWELQR